MQLVAILFLVGISLCGQRLMVNPDGSRAVLMQSDLATLYGIEKPHDLPCQVQAQRPTLGYDLRFHAGYSVQCKPGDLLMGGRLTVIFRVTPEAGGMAETFFSQTVSLPSEVPDGDVVFEGYFDVGPGKYTLEWMIRDSRDRRYAKSWRVTAMPPEESMLFSLGTGSVRPANEMPAVADDRPTGIPVHLLVNLSPPENSWGLFPESDRRALYSMIQALATDPRVGAIHTTVFQLDQQKVLFEQTQGSLDLYGMMKAASGGADGTISWKALAEERPVDDFLVELVKNTQAGSPVPVIFLGPSVQRVGSKAGGTMPSDLGVTVAYINYAPDPSAIVWDDPIRKLTHKLKGTRYLIRRPEDLLRSLNSLFTSWLR